MLSLNHVGTSFIDGIFISSPNFPLISVSLEFSRVDGATSFRCGSDFLVVSSSSLSRQPLRVSSSKFNVNNCFRKEKHRCTRFKSISKELKQISMKEAIKTISSKTLLMSVESKLLKCVSIFLTAKSS